MRTFRVQNPETGVIHHISGPTRARAERYFDDVKQFEADRAEEKRWATEGEAFFGLLVGLEALRVARRPVHKLIDIGQRS